MNLVVARMAERQPDSVTGRPPFIGGDIWQKTHRRLRLQQLGDSAHLLGMVAALRTPQSFRERVGAWRHLPTFVRLVWDASPTLTLASLTLRLARSVIPVLVLYVSKLIFDAVVTEARLPHPGWSPAEWIESGRLVRVGWLVALELGLAVMADFSGWLSSSTACSPRPTAISPASG
jgi:hypothetical protein